MTSIVPTYLLSYLCGSTTLSGFWQNELCCSILVGLSRDRCYIRSPAPLDPMLCYPFISVGVCLVVFYLKGSLPMQASSMDYLIVLPHVLILFMPGSLDSCCSSKFVLILYWLVLESVIGQTFSVIFSFRANKNIKSRKGEF